MPPIWCEEKNKLPFLSSLNLGDQNGTCTIKQLCEKPAPTRIEPRRAQKHSRYNSGVKRVSKVVSGRGGKRLFFSGRPGTFGVEKKKRVNMQKKTALAQRRKTAPTRSGTTERISRASPRDKAGNLLPRMVLGEVPDSRSYNYHYRPLVVDPGTYVGDERPHLGIRLFS